MKNYLFLIATFILAAPGLQGKAQKPSHAAAINAFEAYYEAFESYEKMTLKTAKDRIAIDWDRSSTRLREQKNSLSKQSVSQLKTVLQNYRNYLEENQGAPNYPDALFNLAHTMIKIAGHKATIDQVEAKAYREEAVNALALITERYPRFANLEQTLYLQAVQLELLGEDKTSQKIWQRLADQAKTSIYGAYAQIAIGDDYFNGEKAAAALKRYRKAHTIIKRLDANLDQDYELVRVQYRIAWAAYRSAELGLCIATGIEILTPGRSLRRISRRTAIEADTMELIGDALYENNKPAYSKAILGRSALQNYSSGIAMRMLKRYLSAKAYERVIDLGSYVVEKFPKAKHLPDILTMLAQTYEKTDQPEMRLESLEKLAILLPKSSLWRKGYSSEFETITNMEAKAFSAAVILASHYYKIGLISSNKSALLTATSYYQGLIDYSPNHQEAVDWHLKMGHGYYLAGDYLAAKKIYTDLIQNKKLQSKELQVASYQLILAEEAVWQQTLASEDNKSSSNVKDKAYLVLQKLEQTVENYSNKFPNSKFKVKALLKIAAASRDMQLHDEASRYWQRVLVSNPSISDRGVALRGIAHASTQTLSRRDTIATLSRYLTLENWADLGRSLKTEFQSLLTATVKNESNILNESGDLVEAALLLEEIATKHPHLPEADSLLRDAAYMYAIAGNWQKALNISQKGLDKSRFKHRGDMSYLMARAYEFQMRFPVAAESYFNFGIQFPKHKRAAVALARAQRLAKAEGRLMIAAKAAGIRAKMAKDRQEKLQLYRETMALYKEMGDHDQALIAAKNSKKYADSIEERLSGRLQIAQGLYAIGKEDQALTEFQAIASDAKRYRDQIDRRSFAENYGTAHYLLAMESKDAFDGYNISASGGTLESNIKTKSRYFEAASKHFGEAIVSTHPEYRVKSRYMIADSAEKLAYDLKYSIARETTMSEQLKERYNLQADKLYAVARRYYSDNILDNTRSPTLFFNNPYIKKSAIKITGLAPKSDFDTGFQNLPIAASQLLPQQWSLK